jgi:hypothetical protein
MDPRMDMEDMVGTVGIRTTNLITEEVDGYIPCDSPNKKTTSENGGD